MGTPWNALPESLTREIAQVREHRVVFVVGVLLSSLHIWFNSLGNLASLDQNIIHFAGFALLCGFLYPLATRGPVLWLDRGFVLVVVLCTIYLLWAEDAIYERGLRLVVADWIAGIVVIAGAIELTRRTTGWIIPALIVLALSYIGWWGDYVSGVFRFSGLSTETLIFRSLYGDDALFGNIARISSSFVFIFILFGAFLLRSGAGDFVIHLSKAMAARVVGGPGMVAIVASGLTGTISGSAIANTASTGVVTIPLMKQAGFPPRFAAAVEAAASTGGQLMPPIMGAGAFVMTNYTQIPYATIVAFSFLPALLYFCAVAFHVRIESFKQGLTRPAEAAPPLLPMLFREGLSFILPVTLLIGLLVYGFTPTYAGVFAMLAVVIASWFTPMKMGLSAVLDALALGARNMAVTAVLLCSIGLVVNVIATAGIGNTFSLMVTTWSGGHSIVALMLIALASLVLGMGLPVTAAYIVLATLSAPALLNLMADAELARLLAAGALSDEVQAVLTLASPGVAPQTGTVLSPEQATSLLQALPEEIHATLRTLMIDTARLEMLLLAAHLIIFWLSQDSNVTPPVCLCTFTAAAIAKTPPMVTGITSWKVAKGLYVIPLLFAYTPLITGDLYQALEVFVFALAGLYAFTAVMQGWARVRLNLFARALVAVCAVGLFWPAALTVHALFLTALVGTLMLVQRGRPRAVEEQA